MILFRGGVNDYTLRLLQVPYHYSVRMGVSAKKEIRVSIRSSGSHSSLTLALIF